MVGFSSLKILTENLTKNPNVIFLLAAHGRQGAAVTSFLLFYSHAVGNFVHGALGTHWGADGVGA